VGNKSQLDFTSINIYGEACDKGIKPTFADSTDNMVNALFFTVRACAGTMMLMHRACKAARLTDIKIFVMHGEFNINQVYHRGGRKGVQNGNKQAVVGLHYFLELREYRVSSNMRRLLTK